MDRPVMQWLHRNISREDVLGAQVLEVGSGDVNGSVRPHIVHHWPASYLGVDIAPGKGVDVVVSAHELVDTFGRDAFDVVLSTEMLEHVEDWRDAVRQMAAVLRPNGLLVLSTRAPGFVRHCHPWDHWRFTTANLRQALHGAFDVVTCQYVLGQGIVVKARKLNPPPGRALTLDLIDKVNPKAAPAKEIKDWKLRYLWAVWAYRGTPSEPEPCCPPLTEAAA